MACGADLAYSQMGKLWYNWAPLCFYVVKNAGDGKEHRYWSIVENRRIAGGKSVQKHLLYLGEINDCQQQAWRRSIEVFSEEQKCTQQWFLFPSDRAQELNDEAAVHVLIGSMTLHRPRQWGAGWLAGLCAL